MHYSILLLVLLVGDGSATTPDRLQLEDGSLLVGTILQLEDGNYTIEVAGLGKIKVPAAQVTSATIEKPSDLITDADEKLNGPLQLTDDTWTIINPLGERTVPGIRVVAINPTPVLPPTSTQKATITLNGSKTTGNTRTTSAAMNLDYTFRYLTHRFVSKVNWAYGEDDAIISKRTTGAEVKYDFFPRDTWFLYTSFSARNDDFADLALRTTAGIGAGVQIFDTESLNWSEETGISALNEDFSAAEDESTNTMRVAGNLEWAIEDGLLEVFHNHTLFISLDSSDKMLAEARLGMRTRIVGGLSLNAQVNLRHDSQPPASIEKNDVELLLGLGFSTDF